MIKANQTNESAKIQCISCEFEGGITANNQLTILVLEIGGSGKELKIETTVQCSSVEIEQDLSEN